MVDPVRAAASAPFLLLGWVLLAEPAQAREEERGRTDSIVVTGRRDQPATLESADADELARTTALVGVEDSLRYLPSLLVRKRHVGDTQAPLATRTSGVGASARSLIYADGILLSALIGNNNSVASPRWGMVSPEEIERVEVLYGPFSAAYPGNSIGAVVNLTTRFPERLEGSLHAAASVQSFSQYGTSGVFPSYRLAGTLGGRSGKLHWFAAAGLVDGRGQPLAYVTASRGPEGSAGIPVRGGYRALSRTGAPVWVIGSGGIEALRQETLSLKVAYDLTPSLSLSYRAGLFLNDTDARAETYLSGPGGPVYAGSLNIGGTPATIAASAFSNNFYRLAERHWMHSLAVDGRTGGWVWRLLGSLYEFDRDAQHFPSGPLPSAAGGGPGSVLKLDGTGWRTLDVETRRGGLRAGLHYDRFRLSSNRYAAADWIRGEAGLLVQASLGRTRTEAAWVEQNLPLASFLSVTLGARYERWRAYGGFNYSASPALAVRQPILSREALSPKASLRLAASPAWTMTLSGGEAYRFPTVSELYQAVSTGPTLAVPDPRLRPERARSGELALERLGADGHLRLSLFAETVRDALISQTAPLVAGSPTLASYVQNVPSVHTRGVELAFERRGLLLPQLELSGSLTLAEPRVVRDPAVPAAEGRLLPQVPRRRATLVATWHARGEAALTLAARYASRAFATIDNSDRVGHAYQGFESYFVMDARASLPLAGRWRAALGVENLTNRKYFMFHPFPQRSFTAELALSF